MRVCALLSFFCFIVGPVLAGVPADLTLTQFSATTFNSPVAVRSPRDGSSRIFIVEKSGTVKIINQTGDLLGTYLTVSVTNSGEQGLLGMAFDPNFGRNAVQPGYGDFYLAFTAPSSDPQLGAEPDQVVRRFTVADPASNNASSAVSTDIIRIPDLYDNHNGADIHFGPDGYLYYSMGDGGSGEDPNGFAQCLSKKTDDGNSSSCGTVPAERTAYYLLGKMMRLDVRNTTLAPLPSNMCGAPASGAAQYAIPIDNPYAAATDGSCSEIWLSGLRNPFRFSFDRATGDMWIGDVGQYAYEEIDLRTMGSSDNRNYGWNLCEGSHFFGASGSGSCPSSTSTTAPLLDFNHDEGCSVTGGFRFRGPIGALIGTYAFTDFCSGKIYLLQQGSGSSTCPGDMTVIASGWVCTLFAPLSGTDTVSAPSSFGEDEDGNLYLTTLYSGIIYKFNSQEAIFANGFDW